MVKFAANLASLWAELPYLDRFEAAAEAGFEGVSVPFPYEAQVKDTQRALLRFGLDMVQITAPPPNYTGGARGFAAQPELKDRFRYDLRRALRYNAALRAPILQITAGTASGDDARACLTDNLCFAVGTLPDSVVLTLEPRALAGAFLNRLDSAIEVIAAVGSPRLGLQLHLDQLSAMDLDVRQVLRDHGPVIRHVQTGPIPLEKLGETVRWVEGMTQSEWIAVDFDTGGDTDSRIGWLRDYLSD